MAKKIFTSESWNQFSTGIANLKTKVNNIINGTQVVAKATNASSATYASTATYAISATSATYATTATKAGTATYANSASTASQLKTARQISLNGRVSGSTSFDGTANVTITTTDGQHISGRDSGAYYIELGKMVTDDSGNYGNITITGRIGGWEQGNSAYFDIMMLNRSSARDGKTITATVSSSGKVETALTLCDIVVYKSTTDTSSTVYLKTNSYWLYDFDWSAYQHTITYTGTKNTTTPAGELIWSLSTAPKTILDEKGVLSASTFSGTLNGLATSATYAESVASHNHDDSYYTKSQANGKYYGYSRGSINTDTSYDAKLYMVSSGSNVPCGSDYGVLLGMPYRALTGNKIPDFGAQIFMPNGDDNTHPNSMFYRTSLANTWNPWQEVATRSDIISVERGGTGQTSITDTKYTTARYRASSLHSSDTNPSTNGVIAWTYK